MAKTVRIEKELCIGCGLCNAMAPNYFDWDDDGQMVAIVNDVAPEDEDLVQGCADDCPTQAIMIE